MPKGMETGMDHGGVRVQSTTLVSNQLRTEELLISRMYVTEDMDHKTLAKGILYTHSREVPCAKNHVYTGAHLTSSARMARFQHIT